MPDPQKDENFLVCTGLAPVVAALLRRIPEAADTEGSPEAQARIHPPPAGPGLLDPEWSAEWNEWVVPDLHGHFVSALEVVTRDLEQYLVEDEPGQGGLGTETFTLHLPMAHADDWLLALNQARLVLAARYQLTEKELSGPLRHRIGSPRDLALMQIDIYARFQHLIIEEM